VFVHLFCSFLLLLSPFFRSAEVGDKVKAKNVFSLNIPVTNKKTKKYLFSAESRREMELWIDVLRSSGKFILFWLLFFCLFLCFV